MKKLLKLIGIIAVVAIIGFSMACGDDNDNFLPIKMKIKKNFTFNLTI